GTIDCIDVFCRYVNRITSWRRTIRCSRHDGSENQKWSGRMLRCRKSAVTGAPRFVSKQAQHSPMSRQLMLLKFLLGDVVIPPFLECAKSRELCGKRQFLFWGDAAKGHVGPIMIVGP